jgi:hypothetical protein
MEQFDSRYFNGQGPLFLGSRDANGNPTGLIFVGDIASAELTPQIEDVKVYENVTGTAAVGARWRTRTEFQINLVMRSIKPDHLARHLQGTATAKAGTTVTDEAVKGYLGKFTFLAHNKISAVTVTDSTAVTTYVAGTDYILHADIGAIEIPASGSTITDGQDLKVDYTYASQHHIQVAPANADTYLIFAGKNRADNDKQTRCEIYKCQLDPGVLGFIQTGQEANIPISGTVLLDSLRSAGDQFYSWKTED